MAEYGESWRPEPGDRIIGKVLTRKLQATRNGDAPMVVVAADQGNVTVWCSGVVLRSKFFDLVAEGNTVDVTFEGLKTSKAGREYRSYQVEIGE
jgi:hypothetical protein